MDASARLSWSCAVVLAMGAAVDFYFGAEPAPSRWRKPHDGKEGFGGKLFCLVFQAERFEIISDIPLLLSVLSQVCRCELSPSSYFFFSFRSDLDPRAVSY